MRYYHATGKENLGSILVDGIHTGCDGVVYLCKEADESARFPAIHGVKDIVAFGIDVPEKDIRESHDHSEAFFRCKAYTYGKDIPASRIKTVTEYKL